MIINYFNKTGEVEKIYEKAFNEKDIGDYNFVIDENDPRYKLRKMLEEQEWEKFKNKSKIPVAIYPDRETMRKQLEAQQPLPYNPDLIVVPKDPKNKKLRKRERVVKVINDIPREGKMFKRDADSNYYETHLGENAKTEDEYNDIMLINEINLRHPRNHDSRGTPYKIPLCEDIGMFGWKDKWMYNEFSRYGIGLGDYFRLLKYNLLFFLIVFLFGVIYYAINVINYDTVNLNSTYPDKIFGYSKFKDAAFKLSLGYYRNHYYMCNLIPIDNIDFIYDYSCETVTNEINEYVNEKSIAKFSFLSGDEEVENCHNYARDSYIDSKCDISTNITKKNVTCSDDGKHCTINLKNITSIIPNGCPNNYILLQYACSRSIKGKESIQLSYLVLNYILIIVLIGNCYLLYFLFKKSMEVQKDNYYELNQYSVHIKNLEIDPRPPQLYLDLNELLKTVLNASMFEPMPPPEYEDFFNCTPIYDPTVSVYQFAFNPFENLFLDLSKEKYKFLSHFEIPFYTNKKQNLFTSPLANNKYNFGLYKGSKTKEDLLNEIIKFNHELSVNEDNNYNIPINDIYFTFKTKLHAEKFYNCYKSKNCLYRFWMWFICKKKDIKPFYYKNSWLDVEMTPCQSEGINYENIRIDSSIVNKRRNLSRCIVAVMIIINLAIYFYGVSKQRKLDNIYDTYANCDYIYKQYTYDIPFNILLNEYENLEYSRNKVLNFCYCKHNYLTYGEKYTRDLLLPAENRGYYLNCFQFSRRMTTFKNSYIGMYIMLTIMNLFAFFIFPILSKYERHKTISEERIATMTKTFTYFLFSYCINIILTNGNICMKYRKKAWAFPILTGNSYNINSIWFYNSGTTICLNFLISFISPYATDYIKWFIVHLIRKYGMKGILKEKNKYKFLFWFIGPEMIIENKMGNFLAMFCTCLLLNFTFTEPLFLFFLSLLSFTSFYLDKILFIRYCKIPLQYTQSLNKTYLSILHFFIICSLLFNFYFSGEIYYDIPDTLNIKKQFLLFIHDWRLLPILLIALLSVIIPYFIIAWLPCCRYTCCKKRSVAFGFGEDIYFEENAMKDFTIFEAIPMSMLYKNYVIRKLEFTNVCKYSLDVDLTELLKYYRQRLDADRAAIREKLKFLTEKECAIDTGFDNRIKNIMDKYEEMEDAKIQSNYSYSLCYHPLYQTPYLNQMLK